MAIFYLSVVEYIKKHEYGLWVPAFYHPHMPKDMINPTLQPRERTNRFKMVPVNRRNPLPFRQTVDPSQMQRANYSTEVMLDMFQRKIEFEIVDDHDIPLIFDGLDRYLLSLKPDIESGDEYSITYGKLVLRYRAELYKHYYRYMNTHPDVLETLYPNNNRTENLLHLMSNLGIRKENHELDPLKAKAYPPYDIDDSQPKSSDMEQNSCELSSSLGLSNNANIADDGRDFNFDDFVNR